VDDVKGQDVDVALAEGPRDSPQHAREIGQGDAKVEEQRRSNLIRVRRGFGGATPPERSRGPHHCDPASIWPAGSSVVQRRCMRAQTVTAWGSGPSVEGRTKRSSTYAGRPHSGQSTQSRAFPLPSDSKSDLLGAA